MLRYVVLIHVINSTGCAAFHIESHTREGSVALCIFGRYCGFLPLNNCLEGSLSLTVKLVNISTRQKVMIL